MHHFNSDENNMTSGRKNETEDVVVSFLDYDPWSKSSSRPLSFILLPSFVHSSVTRHNSMFV